MKRTLGHNSRIFSREIFSYVSLLPVFIQNFRLSVVEYRKILTHHFENDLISILERLESPQLYDRHQIKLMKKFTFQKGPLSFIRGRKSRLSLKPGSSQPKNYPVPFENVWDGVQIPPKIHECTINNDVIKARSSCSHKCGPKCNRYCKSDEFINSICSRDGSGESFPIRPNAAG